MTDTTETFYTFVPSPKNYIGVTERRDKYVFDIHHDSSVLVYSTPLASRYIYNSREEATTAAVKILVALLPEKT